MKRFACYGAAVCLAALILGLVSPRPAGAEDEFKVWVAATLPSSAEGLGFGPDGDLYAALGEAGEIYRIAKDGSTHYVASVPSKEDAGHGLLLGLDFDAAGNIFVAYRDLRSRYAKDVRSFDKHHMACKDATDIYSGVYRVDHETREVTPVATRGDGWAMCLPDDITIDREGNIYVADLTFSGIWKITPDGSRVDLWSAHHLLNWNDPPSSGMPLGTNVIVLDRQGRNIYAGTDGDPMVVRVPVREDGSAGEAVMVAMGFTPLNGIALDEKGNIFVSELLADEIKVISPDGSQRLMVATARTAPLNHVASLAYRDGVLCVTNFNIALENELPPRTVVCMSGFAVPDSEPEANK